MPSLLSLIPWSHLEKTRTKARASRKSLHLCSPCRRGMRASLGNKRPKRAIVRRIHTGRFCLWCLTNCKEGRKEDISDQHKLRKRLSYSLYSSVPEVTEHACIYVEVKPCELRWTLWVKTKWANAVCELMFPQHQLVSRKQVHQEHIQVRWLSVVSGPLISMWKPKGNNLFCVLRKTKHRRIKITTLFTI